MKVELIGALDYKKVEELLKEKGIKEEESKELIEELKDIETRRRAEITSSAGRLSRFNGNVFEILGLSEEKTLEQNSKYVKNVVGMGHSSIIDHDYCVFAIKDVTPVIEQIIIEERFSSFTIKSRREVDFSSAGYYVPNFHDENGNIIMENKEVQSIYKHHMMNLFEEYNKLIADGIKKEDARFVLPYSFHSNIIMGVDSHTLKDMIIKYTKTDLAKIDEVKEFGDKLYEIAKTNMPYLIPIIDKEGEKKDTIKELLDKDLSNEKHEVIKKPKIYNATNNIDDTILISAIMRRYQFDYEKAKRHYETLCKSNPNYKEMLMRLVTKEGDREELSQVNIDVQIPTSYAIATHYTRHRTHNIMFPKFVPLPDLTQYKKVPSIEKNHKEEYDRIFKENANLVKSLKEIYGIRDEDLIYFTLSGNTVNFITNMNGKTIEHILRLRECNKAQWETRQIARGIHDEIKRLKGAEEFSKVLGPTCETEGMCYEGKECCGKVYTLKNCKMPPKNN